MTNSTPDDLVIQTRLTAYTFTSLVLGPLACTAGVIAILVEQHYCTRRRRKDRISFYAVSISEIISGVMQTIFGLIYLQIILKNVQPRHVYALDLAGEFVNAIYVICIVFSTCTIMQISYLRWVDLHSLRVGGIRALEHTHWLQIALFTLLTGIFVVFNKVMYVMLSFDKRNETFKWGHTLSFMSIGFIWLSIFVACSYWNLRIIKIALSVRRPRASDNQRTPSLNTQWIRLTLAVYNLASILFLIKIVDSTYIMIVEKTRLGFHTFGMVNHIFQTTALLALPVLWLFFCTHFYIDFSRREQHQRDDREVTRQRLEERESRAQTQATRAMLLEEEAHVALAEPEKEDLEEDSDLAEATDYIPLNPC